jgi:hypothetical protein
MSPFDCRLQGCRYSQWIITIAVKDRTVECLTKVGAVGGGTRMDRIGGETNLIVDNDVDSTSDIEIFHTGHLHGLVDYTLSSKGSISVQQYGNHVADIFRAILMREER